MSVAQFAQYVLGGGLALAVSGFFIGAMIIMGVRFGDHLGDAVSDWFCVRREARTLDFGYAQLCDEEESA